MSYSNFLGLPGTDSHQTEVDVGSVIGAVIGCAALLIIILVLVIYLGKRYACIIISNVYYDIALPMHRVTLNTFIPTLNQVNFTIYRYYVSITCDKNLDLHHRSKMSIFDYCELLFL